MNVRLCWRVLRCEFALYVHCACVQHERSGAPTTLTEFVGLTRFETWVLDDK